MRLLQAAVFMNAGSYVIIPNSSGVTLIWRRSVALIVPSWIGTSYCLPVRLSVIVSVSAIEISQVRASSASSVPARFVVAARHAVRSTTSVAAIAPSVARSGILQRSLQNGRHAGSAGCRRQ